MGFCSSGLGDNVNKNFILTAYTVGYAMVQNGQLNEPNRTADLINNTTLCLLRPKVNILETFCLNLC